MCCVRLYSCVYNVRCIFIEMVNIACFIRNTQFTWFCRFPDHARQNDFKPNKKTTHQNKSKGNNDSRNTRKGPNLIPSAPTISWNIHWMNTHLLAISFTLIKVRIQIISALTHSYAPKQNADRHFRLCVVARARTYRTNHY